MAQLLLRWIKVTFNNQEWYDSNIIILKGNSGVHLEVDGTGNYISVFQSMTGINFVTRLQDYFGPVWDMILPFPGIGQAIKLRVNKLPTFGIIKGDVQDGGDGDATDNAFAGWDKQNDRYHDVSFEEEAHSNDTKWDYLKERLPFSWISYVKLRSYKK